MHAHDFQEPKRDTIWTKYQVNQQSTHKCDKKINCPNYIKDPNQHLIEDTTLKRYLWNQDTKLMKISSRNKPNPLHFSRWHKVPRQKMFVFQEDTSSGSNIKWRQLMFKKHIGLLPQDVCIIYDFAFEYTVHTHEIITLHIYYSNTSHVHEGQEIAIPI